MTVIINGSPHINGNTSALVNMVIPKIKGDINIINTFYENISPCGDCRKCYSLPECFLAKTDKGGYFMDLIKDADNIIIASPLYYSMLSGSLLNFVSRFQYFFVSQNIRKDNSVFPKRKKGFLVLTGGGATKDFYPVEKVTKLIFSQINSSFDGILKYMNCDKMPLDKLNKETEVTLKKEIDFFMENFQN